MMARRLLLVVVAGLVVLAAGAWALWEVRENRAGVAGGVLELTELEMPLVGLPGESTVTLLDLSWGGSATGDSRDRSPRWLDAARLAELGFDCSVPLDARHAPDHYRSRPLRPVFLVLELAGEPASAPPGKGAWPTRLRVIDAGRDPDGLRRRYPDPRRQAIVHGLVRLAYVDRDDGGVPLATPRLEGRVVEVLPSQLFVPLPFSRTLAPFRDRPRPEAGPAGARRPRYAVTVAWGDGFQPWITAVRVLAPETPGPPP